MGSIIWFLQKRLMKRLISYKLLNSLKSSSAGIISAFKNEPAIFLEILIGAIFFGILYILQLYNFIIINFILLCFVLSLEMVNTAIESLRDFIEPGYNAKIGLIKDIAGGAVLITGFFWIVLMIYLIITNVVVGL